MARKGECDICGGRHLVKSAGKILCGACGNLVFGPEDAPRGKSIFFRTLIFTIIIYLILSHVTGYSIKSVYKDFMESDFVADTFIGDLLNQQDRAHERAATDTSGATGRERPGKEAVAETIEEYFTRCNERNFEAAYQLFSNGYRERVSYDDYYTRIAIFYGWVLRLNIRVVASNSRIAGAEVMAEFQDVQGYRETYRGGPVVTVFERGRWRIDSIELEHLNSGGCD